ncbi:LysR family transcriptional regulator [Gluconacetobacter entanii]|uniref:LysR family transcriptional regulator n=1 Tax=Gluconacetobacter entanii TaxID=108528 RepID=A0A318PSR3_9PROT|nr:LysR family transcriptional regulator [Gluconacetobacter entanii]MBE7620590.1 LysR family transcriptional regulator [Komagataeibacter sp. FXV2]MCE2579199.1 LysR family transcriptional regulator [Komagataeibacter sp. FNDCR1]MBY4640928.1 LysR family transcriptional regulator [Gluconacetobacter entanii]MCW4580547.1 LysR family transcriptional regulator [Gluconacetobacter entanii]MCW4583832.1 LysR family transcriptional regulator [Gluconacetobacter entanii]
MDLLSALHSFVRVAATGSFSAVSRETGASQPTISRHIALLEAHYGATLFARTTRSLMMTEDGRSLLPHAYEVLEILETAETALGRRRASVSGLVRLGVTTAFGLYLTGKLGKLLEEHPDLSVELVMRDGFGDLVEEGLDLAVRVGSIAEGSLIARRLGSVRRYVVASSDYLARRGTPAHPRDLLNHPCIAYSYGGSRHDWHFECKGEENVVAASGPFRANSSEAVLQAVRSGLGIGMLPSFQVEEDIASGRLIHLFPEWTVPEMPFYAVHTGPRTLPLRTRTVLDFLIDISDVLRQG